MHLLVRASLDSVALLLRLDASLHAESTDARGDRRRRTAYDYRVDLGVHVSRVTPP